MSMRARVASVSRGKVRMSLTSLRVNPKLPAPMNAILAIAPIPPELRYGEPRLSIACDAHPCQRMAFAGCAGSERGSSRGARSRSHAWRQRLPGGARRLSPVDAHHNGTLRTDCVDSRRRGGAHRSGGRVSSAAGRQQHDHHNDPAKPASRCRLHPMPSFAENGAAVSLPRPGRFVADRSSL